MPAIGRTWRYWTTQEIAKFAPHKTIADIARETGRTYKSVHGAAVNYGLPYCTTTKGTPRRLRQAGETRNG